jgi:ABC-type polysaccharide/polyol phosphate transport system ATPase subunit/GT2 family glycosyltransferase
VTFDVAPGEVIGLIGPNGAGKTTLLRTIAGIYRPDEGTVDVRGRVTPLLSNSAGLNPLLSGWDNVTTVGVLLGFSRKQMRAVGGQIAAFAGLGEFMDAPVRVYSSGMRARLGFAIAAFTDPDIMVLDEALSVGDAQFKEQSRDKMRELIRGGRTVLMATHDLVTLQELCHRLVRLESGRVVEVGTPDAVSQHYLDRVRRGAARVASGPEALALRPGGREGDPPVSVVIPAYEESRHIAACLGSLQAQTYRPLEIVVVDDGSRDRTADEVATFTDVRLVRQPHRGAGAARNRGAGEARGEILVFLDADMTFPPEFIERLVAPMVHRGAVGTFTRDIRVANGDRRWARAHMLGRGLPTHSHFPPGFPDRWENFRAIWRSEFLQVGGFDEVGHGEDVTLGRKLGRMAEAAPGAVCYHFEPEGLGDILRTARWVGRGERIAEVPRPLRRYGPLRSVPRAVRLARRHRMPSLLVYRLVYDAGVTYGWLTRNGRRSAGK